MRRTAILATLMLLPGCTGFGTFLDHAFSLPGTHPNLPMTDSENMRRVLGNEPGVLPLQPEPGNVWPGPQAPDPTLADLQNQGGTETSRGFPPTTAPGGTGPALPDHQQPRPLGSSTPTRQHPARRLRNHPRRTSRAPPPLDRPRPGAPRLRRPNPARPRSRRRRHVILSPAHHPPRPRRHHGPQRQRHQHHHQPQRLHPDRPHPPLTMLQILYFAWVKDRMGKPAETIARPEGVATVEALATWLRNRDEPGARAFAQPDLLRAAVNQDFATPATPIADNDEVAFFPPVTGG